MCLKGTSVCDHCTSLRQLSSQNLVTTMMLEGVLVNSGLFSSPGLFSKAMKTNNQQRWHQCGPLSPCQLHPGCWSSNDIYWWWLGLVWIFSSMYVNITCKALEFKCNCLLPSHFLSRDRRSLLIQHPRLSENSARRHSATTFELTAKLLEGSGFFCIFFVLQWRKDSNINCNTPAPRVGHLTWTWSSNLCMGWSSNCGCFKFHWNQKWHT